MNQCLRCGKICEQGLFCNHCQSALLRRSLKEQEMHEGLAQVSLARHGSLAELNAGKSPEQDPVVQTSLRVPVQDVTSGREQDQFSDRPPNKVPWYAKRSTTLATLQALSPQRVRLSRLRYIFFIMLIISIAALIIDSIFVSLLIYRHQIHTNSDQNSPLITFAPGTIYPGKIARLHLSHFPAGARVLLRRDIEKQLRPDTGSPLVQLGSAGEADVHIPVEDNWGAGRHFLEAEDIDTHYVASTVIQVMGSGLEQVPHLQVSQSELDLGADLQDANTLQSLTLENTGGGIISWTAQSSQPWLLLTPMRGIFNVSQRVMLAVNRSSLKSGTYEGIVTFVVNNGFSVPVDVKMSVLPLKTDLGAALVVSPPVLSFVATDGGPDLGTQILTVSNPGSRPLYWSLSGSAPMVSVNGEVPFMDNMNWLHVKPTSGVIAPGLTTSIHFTVSSHMLLPGVYNRILTFTGGLNTLNSPQLVAVSLDVQSRCGVVANTGNISFSLVTGRKSPMGQALALSLLPGCSGSVAWRASSMANWLAITPSSGRVKAQADSLTTLTTNISGLLPGTYTSFLVFLTDHRTQTVAVQLTVMESPGKSARSTHASSSTMGNTSNIPNGLGTTATSKPALGVSPTSIIFSVTQGEGNPPNQAVTVVNTGGSLLYWQAHTDTNVSPWLQISPATGSIVGGQNGHIFLSVNTGSLSPGTYRSNVMVSATDSSSTQVSESPQEVAVVLNVVQPCVLRVTPTNLTFSASLLAPEPSGEDITLQTVGSCAYPVAWSATVDANSRSWLMLSAVSGQESGNGSVITVHVNTSGMLLGFYQGQISVSAVDRNSTSVGSTTPTVGVALTVIG